ncbi:MAG: ABC transporter transmembrane domain-containing protein, partial [Pseudomonadota bacterium]|nr:ABC transporter transmembrane domain-containing protein [Pseudomonadota bacterium]
MSKEKLPNRQVLNSWCKDLDSAHKLGLRASLITLVFIKCLSLFSLLIGFYFFAAIAHSWVVTGTSASSQVLILLALSLGSAWMLQGMFNHVFLQRKFVLLGMLEQLLLSTLLTRQHAIVRTQSPYFWQVLWHNQLEAFTDWAMEYRVQQWVALIVPIMALGVIFAVNPILGLGLLLTLPVVPLFMIIVGKGAAALHRKHFVALERLGSLFTDRLSALSM